MEIIEQHLGIVRKAAKYFRFRKLPPSIDVDDLYQVGVIAFMKAAPKYLSENGASFETYTGHRVYGAMLDEIRAATHGVRSEKKNSNRVSIDTQYAYEAEDEDMTPPENYQSERILAALSESFDVLSPREQVIVYLYHRDSFSLSEVGEALGFSESRACQIIGGAVKKLAVVLQEWK